MINRNDIKQKAIFFENVAMKYSDNDDVKKLLMDMDAFIANAKSGKIKSPIDRRCIPRILDTDIPRFSELENAFASFVVSICDIPRKPHG